MYTKIFNMKGFFILKITKDFIWKITKTIGKTLNKSDEELEIINYGLQVLILNFLKLLLLFITAYLLGILKYTVLAVFVFSALRTFASGVHAKTTLICITSNYILFLGNVYLSKFINYNFFMILLIFILSMIFIILYSPADTKERPIINKELRKSLKIKSIILVIIFFIVSLIINIKIYSNIIAFAILEESFCTTPIAYRLLGKEPRNKI